MAPPESGSTDPKKYSRRSINNLIIIIMNNIFNLKKRIMARIYFEYTKSILVNHPDYFMLAIFVIVCLTSVSILDVFRNLPKDNFSSVFNFSIAAVLGTSWIIQVLIAGFFIRVIVSGGKLGYKNLNIKDHLFYRNI